MLPEGRLGRGVSHGQSLPPTRASAYGLPEHPLSSKGGVPRAGAHFLEGQGRVDVEASYPFTGGIEALETGHARGKVVLSLG